MSRIENDASFGYRGRLLMVRSLEDLPPEDEYAELSLENFMSKV